MTTPNPTTVIVVAYNPGKPLGEVHVCKNLQSAYRKMVALSRLGWQRLWLRPPLPVR